MQVGDESYESYTAERDEILSSLARRAKVSLFLESLTIISVRTLSSKTAGDT